MLRQRHLLPVARQSTDNVNTLIKPLRLVSRRLCAEDGVALLLAISVVAVLTIAAGATIQIVQSGQISSTRERQTARAMAIGEAGLDKALYTIAANDPNGTLAPGSTVSSTSFSFDGGSGTYSATKQADGSWV